LASQTKGPIRKSRSKKSVKKREPSYRTRSGNKTVVHIPADYYRFFVALGAIKNRKRGDWRRAYETFSRRIDALTTILYDQAEGPYRVIGRDGLKVTLEKTDCPFDCYWTQSVLEQLSDECGLGGLWERALLDP
jgi:hypothetical protein